MPTTAWTPETSVAPATAESSTTNGTPQTADRLPMLKLCLKILLSILRHLAFPFS